ncbi:hypothetical protein FOCC_FOCC003811 [Frankliniella occidentalis]|nr:hypothetical protein FOCC_FOCC003811 [Frankliniella occidentalis]
MYKIQQTSILLQRSKILACLGEFSLLHTLSNIPVNKGTLGVHQVEFMIEASPCLSNGCGIGKHADCSCNLGQVTTRDDGWGLVVDANLEASRAPINKLDALLSFDVGDGGIDILGHNVTSVQKATGHVLSMARVTLHHLVGWLKARICHFSY